MSLEVIDTKDIKVKGKDVKLTYLSEDDFKKIDHGTPKTYCERYAEEGKIIAFVNIKTLTYYCCDITVKIPHEELIPNKKEI